MTRKLDLYELIKDDPEIKKLNFELTPRIQKFLLEAQKIFDKNGENALIDFLLGLDKVDWIRSPVTPEEFFTTGEYLHEFECATIHPKSLEKLCEICDLDNFSIEVIDTGALGTGKSRRAGWVATYILYLLSCMRNPALYYGLGFGDNLTLGFVAVTKESSGDLAYAYVKNSVDNSPYFTKYFPRNPRVNSELLFDHNIRCLASSPMANDSFIGKNMIFYNLDEISFVEDVRKTRQEKQLMEASQKAVSKASRLYTTAKNRLLSRLLKGEKTQRPLYAGIYICSSRAFPSSWLEDHIKEIRDGRTDNRKHTIIEFTGWDLKNEINTQDTFTVIIGDAATPSYILEDNQIIPEGVDFVNVPRIFKERFEQDIDSALREIAGIATSTVMPLISNRVALFNVYKKSKTLDLPLRHPFYPRNNGEHIYSTTLEEGELVFDLDYFCQRDMDGRLIPRRDPNCRRFIHLDYSINRDATGFCMGYSPSSILVTDLNDIENLGETQRYMPYIILELILQIVPPKGGQIAYDRIKKFILFLKRELGFPIEWITADSAYSFGELQFFENLGFKVDNQVSLDKKPDGHVMMRQAINEGRILMYEHPVARREYLNLKFDLELRKIDHPDFDADAPDGRGSKDVADACSGVVMIITRETLGKTPIMSPMFKENIPVPKKIKEEIFLRQSFKMDDSTKEKSDNYREHEQMLDYILSHGDIFF